MDENLAKLFETSVKPVKRKSKARDVIDVKRIREASSKIKPGFHRETAENDDEIVNEIKYSKETQKLPTANKGIVDSQDKNERTVFVGNVDKQVLTSSSGLATLRKAFREFGKIESIRFRSVAFAATKPRRAAFVTKEFDDSRDSANAYIVFANRDAAKAALALNGHVILGKHIRVDNAARSNYETKKCVFVGGLDFSCSDESIWKHFASCGTIHSVRIVRDSNTNVGKGFAYVQFEDRACVEKALLLDNEPMPLNHRNLRVSRAKSVKQTHQEQNKEPIKKQSALEKNKKPALLSRKATKFAPKRQKRDRSRPDKSNSK